ncbi:MAG: aminoacyl-tRNA hydrolase [Acholeplasmataceae bacterium]
MILFVGLGNPGKKYVFTRHNVGFMVLDTYANRNQLTFKYDAKFDAEISMFTNNQQKVLLCKPSTFMNLSGNAIVKVINYYDIELKDVYIFVDDISLEVGRLRLREKGGHGGHNGLRDIIQKTSTRDFKRIRIGIGENTASQLDHYVLGEFSKDEIITIKNTADQCVELIDDVINGQNYLDIMTKFNTQT